MEVALTSAPAGATGTPRIEDKVGVLGEQGQGHPMMPGGLQWDTGWQLSQAAGETVSVDAGRQRGKGGCPVPPNPKSALKPPSRAFVEPS